MFSRYVLRLSLIVASLGWPLLTSAQSTSTPQPAPALTTCPSDSANAFATTRLICGDTRSGEACIGNGLVESDGRGGSELTFNQPGNKSRLTSFAELRLRTSGGEGNLWAVVAARNLLKTTAAQLSDTTMLMFGDVTLSDTSDVAEAEAAQAESGEIIGRVISDGSLTIRRTPGGDGVAVDAMPAGATFTITGQLADKTWYRIIIPNNYAATGWVYAPYVEIANGDVNQIFFVEANSKNPPREGVAGAAVTLEGFDVMQSFNLISAPPLANCTGAPPSGVLVQSADGLADWAIVRVNGVELLVNGTAFLSAQAGAALRVAVLEGDVLVKLNGIETAATRGQLASIAMSANLEPSGNVEVVALESSALGDLAALPADLLPRLVALPASSGAPALVDAAAGATPASAAPADVAATPIPDATTEAAAEAAPTATPEASNLASGPGSMVSSTVGEVCNKPSATSFSVPGPQIGLAADGGIWKVTAGTTVSISVSGGTLQPSFGDYIRINSAASEPVRSGSSNTLSNTFSTDATISLSFSAAPSETVSVTIRCG